MPAMPAAPLLCTVCNCWPRALTAPAPGPPGPAHPDPAVARRVQPHLLYGPPGSGKTLLCHAIASEAGSTLFDLSPAATDGKYPGKQAALMVHMVGGQAGEGWVGGWIGVWVGG